MTQRTGLHHRGRTVTHHTLLSLWFVSLMQDLCLNYFSFTNESVWDWFSFITAIIRAMLLTSAMIRHQGRGDMVPCLPPCDQFTDIVKNLSANFLYSISTIFFLCVGVCLIHDVARRCAGPEGVQEMAKWMSRQKMTAWIHCFLATTLVYEWVYNPAQLYSRVE